MVDINTRIKPSKFFPWRKSLLIKVPGNWNELSENQFILVPDYVFGRLKDSKFISFFFDMNEKTVSQIDKKSINSIVNYLTWLKAYLPIDHFIIKNIHGFEAPVYRLEGITWYAFALADHFYQEYLRGNVEAIFKLIFCFYYKEKIIEPELMETRSILLEGINSKILDATLLNYILLLKWLNELYPNSFRAYSELKKIDSSITWLSFPWGKKYSMHTAFSYIEYMTRYLFENGRVIDEKNIDLLCPPEN